MAKDNIENKIFHIYLQLGFIIPSTVLLVCSECIHWFSCVSIPFLFGVLPAFILILFLKKGKSRQKQDYSSSDSDSSDGGDVKKLPATTKASLNQIFPLSALAQPHEEACLQNFLSKNKDIDENLAADVFRDIKDKLKFDFLCLKKENPNLMMADQNVEEEILHTKETKTIEKDFIKRKPARKNKKKELSVKPQNINAKVKISEEDMKNAGAVEKESPINNAANNEESTLVSILKVESHESRSSQMIPNISSQQFLLDYDENMGVGSISGNHDAMNDTLERKSASGVGSISADIDVDETETNDEPSTASDSTKETDSEDEKKADSDDNINIINDEST